MNKKKTILIISIAAILFVSIILIAYNRPKDLTAYTVVACSLEDYVQERDIGYLTIILEDRNNTTKVLIVEDSDVQEQLQQVELSDIAGINVKMNIPAKKINDYHINTKNPNVLNMLFNTNQYNRYITVIDILVGH